MLTKWKSGLPLTKKLVGHILPLILKWFFKTLHDPKSQKDFDKDSKHDLYWEHMEMNPNSM